MQKKDLNIKFGIFIFLLLFIAVTIADLFTGSTSRWNWSHQPSVGWSEYIRHLPLTIIGCLIVAIVMTKLCSVWAKHYEKHYEKEMEEVRKRLAEKETEEASIEKQE